MLLTVGDKATGAIYLVQIVDVEVVKTVDRTVVTCCIGLPLGGMIVLVTGKLVTVVKVLWTPLA